MQKQIYITPLMYALAVCASYSEHPTSKNPLKETYSNKRSDRSQESCSIKPQSLEQNENEF